MKLTVFDEIEQVDPEALSVDAASLYRAFEQVKDGWKSKGKRYPHYSGTCLETQEGRPLVELS